MAIQPTGTVIPGMSRSCSAMTPSPTSRVMKPANQFSPLLPLPQLAAASRPAISRATEGSPSSVHGREHVKRTPGRGRRLEPNAFFFVAALELPGERVPEVRLAVEDRPARGYGCYRS